MDQNDASSPCSPKLPTPARTCIRPLSTWRPGGGRDLEKLVGVVRSTSAALSADEPSICSVSIIMSH